MRFLALIKKELRECTPWIILAALTILLWSGLILNEMAFRQATDWTTRTFTSNLSISTDASPLNDTAVIMFLVSVGFGLILGLQQYWLPGFRGIWPFLLHRSMPRFALLSAKIMLGVIVFLLSCGLAWTVLYFYSCRQGFLWIPPALKFFWEGWLLIFIGFIVYLAMALSGLSPARWFTSKILVLAFSAVILIAVLGQYNLVCIFVTLLAGMLIILIQLFHLFINKEF